jgi:hypothetical protein
MFDNIQLNSYRNTFSALFVVAVLFVPHIPLAVAQPVLEVQETEQTAGSDDEDPASANRYYVPITITETLILAKAQELGVDVFELESQLFAFAEMTRHIESDNKRQATNKYSGAMSYYQFLPSSVETAVYRLENLMRDADMGRVPGWASAVLRNPSDIYTLSNAQQRLLVLANIMEQGRSDSYLLRLANGDDQAAIDMYYKFHHTAPDSFTKKRTVSLYPLYFPQEELAMVTK